jgi:hypothetical protein
MQFKFHNLQNYYCVLKLSLFEWGFDLALYFTPAYAGINGNVAVHAAVTDTILRGAFIYFLSLVLKM